MNRRINTGDIIKCKDKEEAGKVADALITEGYKWEFIFEINGRRGIWIEILGRYVDECKGGRL